MSISDFITLRPRARGFIISWYTCRTFLYVFEKFTCKVTVLNCGVDTADDGPEVDVKEGSSTTSTGDDVISGDVNIDEVTWSEMTEDGGKSACGITCHLEPTDLWGKFHSLGTEMIITKSGRLVSCAYSSSNKSQCRPIGLMWLRYKDKICT